ncbi:hypothetical protein NY08_2938 [Rhodococcus sp. B7740]|nr:hypothetical protein NY08_2938 [Rhodococcus sp. B7740]
MVAVGTSTTSCDRCRPPTAAPAAKVRHRRPSDVELFGRSSVGEPLRGEKSPQGWTFFPGSCVARGATMNSCPRQEN